MIIYLVFGILYYFLKVNKEVIIFSKLILIDSVENR